MDSKRGEKKRTEISEGDSVETFTHYHGSINGFADLNLNNNPDEEFIDFEAANTNANASAKPENKASPYAVQESPEVLSVKAALSRIANQSSVRAVLVLDPIGKLSHVQYPSNGITDFDARHMKLDDVKLLKAQVEDFVRDINPQSFLKTLRLRGRNNAVLMEVGEDKSSVMCFGNSKFEPLISKGHI